MSETTVLKENINRPGGFEITDKAINFCNFQRKAKILDIGCGSGASVAYLKKMYNFDTFGIDINSIFETQNCKNASGENIPYRENIFDGVLAECSFSLMNNQTAFLNESYRILKTRGFLIISDMFARGEPAQLNGCLGKIDKKETIFELIEKNNFEIKLFEDFTYSLQNYWGQLIFNQGATAFYCDLGVTPEQMKRIKCGYYLLIAQKTEK